MGDTDENQNPRLLDDNDTSAIAGGLLIGDKHLAKTYKKAGIKVIKHAWKANEFVIDSTGRKISKDDANKIVDLQKLDSEIGELEKELRAYADQEIKAGKALTIDEWYG